MNTMKRCPACSALYDGDRCSKCGSGHTAPATAAEETPLQPGQIFHGLEIIDLLGRGGMGVVYKARQPALDRVVALKILPRRLALDPDFQGRFVREAKALGSLSHPNIVALHDFGAEEGLFFFVMEFVEGPNLRQLIRDRKLAPEEALKLVPQLCDALEFAHAEGVVHRDIKPENILLDKRGRVKIADFGLAKLTGADIKTGMLTMTNMVMGTPHYMAPEQVENPKAVDHRADIYSLGVVLYEMLTGELPIGRFEIPSKKVQIDARIDEVVLRTLEKQPEKRYQSAAEVKNEILRITTQASYSPTVVTPRPEVRQPLPRRAILAVFLALLALPAAILLLRRPAPPAPVDLTRLHFGPDDRPAHYVFAKPDNKLLTRNPLPARDPAGRAELAKYLAHLGLQNISPEDFKQGYLSIWWQAAAGVIALETAAGDRIAGEFNTLAGFENRWTHRDGELLVLAWSADRSYRRLFVELVEMTQKKLGLPVNVPDPPPEHVRLRVEDLPAGWAIREEGAVQWLGPQGELPRVRLEVRTSGEAAGLSGSRRTDLLRAGRVSAALSLTEDDVENFERCSVKLRECMGFPPHGFETMVPAAGELPPGYAFEKVVTEIPTVLETLALAELQTAHVKRAWWARLKPAGTIAILHIEDDAVRRSAEDQLKKRGAAEDQLQVLFGIEGPDDGVLDDLENRMRLKFGWSANSPRPITLRHVRPEPSDFPAGWTLGPVTVETRTMKAEVKSPEGLTLKFTARESHHYGERRMIIQNELGYRPGDVLVDKWAVIVHVGGAPESVEAAFRRKARMKAPAVEDFPEGYPGTKGFVTLWNTLWRTKADLNAVVRRFDLKAADVVAARVDSNDKELERVLLEFRAPERVPAAIKGCALIRKGPFLALFRNPDDAAMEPVRLQLRAAR